MQLVLYPAQVQGVGAGKTIAKGIEQLDKMNMDTIIIGRGGGSIEDLWAFNEEIVARAIFRADTTIADYVADLRAATPSAACELAIPDYFGMLEQFRAYEQALRRPIEHKIQTYRYQLDNKQWQLERVSPKQKLQEKKMRLADLEIKLQDIMEQKIERKRHQIALYTEKLHGLSPTAKLTGGYGFITDKDKKVLRSVTKIQEGDTITVTLIDGEIEATVQHITEQK